MVRAPSNVFLPTPSGGGQVSQGTVLPHFTLPAIRDGSPVSDTTVQFEWVFVDDSGGS